jgi:pimeloyl-ACP methyl ester carboxylesterase/phosphohistidine swiveling domain-containing protein
MLAILARWLTDAGVLPTAQGATQGSAVGPPSININCQRAQGLAQGIAVRLGSLGNGVSTKGTLPLHLLALHGNGGGASRFQLCLPYFEKLGLSFTAHTLPGFEGRPLPKALCWDLLCDDLAAALEKLPRPRALLGPGIGGSLALQYLQHSREPVDFLILQSPVGPHLDRRRFPRLMKPTWIRETVKALLAAPGLDWLWGQLLFGGRLPAPVRRTFFREYARCEAFSGFFDLITRDWFESLRPIDLPGVLLWGARERVLSVAHVEALQPLLPQCKVRIEPSFDHFPMLEQPALFCEVIWQLLCAHQADWLAPEAAQLLPRESGKISGLRQALQVGLEVPASLVMRDTSSFQPQLGPWAVRSAHLSEDDQSQSQAGRYLSLLRVEKNAVGEAAAQVQQAQSQPSCLAMRMVTPEVAGVAFLESDYEEDLVNWVPGLADRLMQGEAAAQQLELPRLDLGGSSASFSWQLRLQKLCQGIRRHFDSSQDWDIEWADDGLTCWLVQIRPIVAPSQRREWFTAANQREILPDPPSPLMVGILRNCRGRLFDYYRQFDPSLPKRRHFLDLFWDRPYINLSLLHGMMLRWGLPSRLVTDSIGGASLPEVPLRPLRLLSKAHVHLRLAWSTGTSLARLPRLCQQLEQASQVENLSLSQTVKRLEEVYLGLVQGMMSLTAGASLPLALLRATSTLAEHNQYFQTATTDLLSDLQPLRGLDPESEPFSRACQSYVKKHGHRGTYESDIARPRIAEDPLAWITPLLSWQPPPRRALSWRARLTLPLAWAARPWVQARERLRSEAMKSFARIRRRLLESEWGQDIFWLQPEQVELPFDSALLDQAQEQRDRLEAMQLPHLLRRFDPPQPVSTPREGPWYGVGLTPGQVQGKVWKLREPCAHLPQGYQRESTVLVAPALDPGWLPTFALVSGVVIEIGGDLSHASLLLREMGLPALTNVADVYASLTDGDEVCLNGASGELLRLVKDASDPS